MATLAGGAEARESNLTKRPRSEEGPLRADLLSDGSRAALRDAFASSQPYTHVVIRDLCRREALVEAREELINSV